MVFRIGYKTNVPTMLERLQLNLKRSVWKDKRTKRAILKFIDSRFAKSEDIFGKPFKELKFITIKTKRSDKPLIKTGAMRAGNRLKVRGDRLIIKNLKNYSKLHQNGLFRAKIDRRSFLGPPPNLDELVLRTVMETGSPDKFIEENFK